MDETKFLNLPCALKSHEITDRALEAGQVDQELIALEDSFEITKKEHKTAVQELEHRRRVLLRELADGSTRRDVECRVVLNYVDGLAMVVRTDTGDVVSQRPLSPEERQAQLFAVENKAKKRGRDRAADPE